MEPDYSGTIEAVLKAYCPMAFVRQITRVTLIEKDPTVDPLNLQLADRTLKKMLKDNGLSLRKPHVKRRTDPDDELIASFLQRFMERSERFRADDIINVDETSWKVRRSVVAKPLAKNRPPWRT